MALQLFFDFLDGFKMDFSRSVFQRESNLRDIDPRESLYQRLGLKTSNTTMPAIVALINKAMYFDERGDPQAGGTDLDGLPRSASGLLAPKLAESKAKISASERAVSQPTSQLKNIQAGQMVKSDKSSDQHSARVTTLAQVIEVISVGITCCSKRSHSTWKG